MTGSPCNGEIGFTISASTFAILPFPIAFLLGARTSV